MTGILYAALIAGIIIAAMFATLLFLRAKGLGNLRRSGRISIADFLDIDKGHRLVLVRRDNVEHLLIIGSNGDTVVETGIAAYGDGKDHVPALRAAPRPVRPLGPALRPGAATQRADEARTEPVLEEKDARGEPEFPA